MNRRTIKGSVTLLSTSQGGRTEPLRSGYRSILRFAENPVQFGFELTLESGLTSLPPGESAAARFSFWAVDALPANLIGLQFEMLEGTRIVGKGQVVQED